MRGLLFCIAVMAAACSSQPAPAWQSAAQTQLANYTESYLAGDERLAGIHFDKALEHISRTGDPALMGRAWLTRCALETAALIEVSCDKAKEYRGDPANDAYGAMIEGGPVKGVDLPGRYHDLASALAKGSVKDINVALEGIDDPISRLIGAGVAVRRRLYDGATLELAAQTASENGWKTPLTAYLLKLKDIYRSGGDASAAATVEERLKILENNAK